MLPVRHDDLVKHRRGFLHRTREKLSSWIRLILADKNSRNLLGFLVLNLSFAFVELFYGVVTNSLVKGERNTFERTSNLFSLCLSRV